MRISARAWSKHEKTRKRLADAWEETKRREPVRRWDGHSGGDGDGGSGSSAHEDDDGRGDDGPGDGKGGREEARRKKKEKKSRRGEEDACVELRM